MTQVDLSGALVNLTALREHSQLELIDILDSGAFRLLCIFARLRTLPTLVLALVLFLLISFFLFGFSLFVCLFSKKKRFAHLRTTKQCAARRRSCSIRRSRARSAWWPASRCSKNTVSTKSITCQYAPRTRSPLPTASLL